MFLATLFLTIKLLFRLLRFGNQAVLSEHYKYSSWAVSSAINSKPKRITLRLRFGNSLLFWQQFCDYITERIFEKISNVYVLASHESDDEALRASLCVLARFREQFSGDSSRFGEISRTTFWRFFAFWRKFGDKFLGDTSR